MPPADRCIRFATADGQERPVHLEDYLDADAIEASERDANAWIKRLRHARVDGVPLRDRFTCRGDSLWWFIELYLHKQRTVVSAFRIVRALEALMARERPARISTAGPPLLDLLAAQVAGRRGVRATTGNAGRALLRSRLRLAARSHFHTLTAVADRVRPTGSATGGDMRVQVAAFVHSAFWRRERDEEGYIAPVLRALGKRLPPGALALVGLGPRTNYRARGWRHRFAEFNDPAARELPLLPIESFAGWRAIRPSMAVWRQRRRILGAAMSSDELRRAAVVEDCDIWPALREDLLGVSHMQLPWSARSMDEAAAALDTLQPSVIVTYAEAGGWGRALALEARRRAIPLVGLQHGFIYRHWLNYLHEADEMEASPGNPADVGFPRPDLTLVYDGFARQHLTEAGHFPPSAVAVTGSPRLEAFAETGRRLDAAERERIRAEAGAKPEQKLVVLATKFTQIGAWFDALVDAVSKMPDTQLAVKCHPAERADPYQAVASSAGNVRILPAATDLGSLVASADLIATVNSTAALEAMAVGVPGLVLALPNNLSPFVDAGALAGARRPGDIGPILRRVLYDEAQRHTLAEGRRAFIERYGMVSAGGAAERAADAILQLAHSRVR